MAQCSLWTWWTSALHRARPRPPPWGAAVLSLTLAWPLSRGAPTRLACTPNGLLRSLADPADLAYGSRYPTYPLCGWRRVHAKLDVEALGLACLVLVCLVLWACDAASLRAAVRLLEPHKRYQNSFTMFQKRGSGFSEPIYTWGP